MRRDQRQRTCEVVGILSKRLAVIEAIERTVAVRLDLRVIHVEQPVQVTAVPGYGIGINRLKQEPRVVGAVGKLRTPAIGLGHSKFAIAPVGLLQRPLGALEQRLPEVFRPRHLVEVAGPAPGYRCDRPAIPIHPTGFGHLERHALCARLASTQRAAGVRGGNPQGGGAAGLHARPEAH